MRDPAPQPPGATQPSAPPATPNHWVWIALTSMAVLGLAVILLLPRWIPAPGTTPVGNNTTPPAASPAPAANQANARAEAEQTLQSWLQLRARLELANAAAWGEPAWSEASKAANRGDRLFGQRDFTTAADAWREGLQHLEQVENSRTPQLTAALAAGQEALANDDVETAANRFEQALRIEPGNPAATVGLARARVRAELLQHMTTGEEAENGGDLETARNAYTRAAALDPQYPPATTALTRVTALLADQRFRATMDRALKALEAGRLRDAGVALEDASRQRPDDVAVRDTRQRLQQARQRTGLQALRRQAQASVETENWQSAITLYEKALRIDGSAAFAREGLPRARARLKLHQQLDHYLADPTRLHSDAPLANAEQLLVSAGMPPADEPQLSRKTAALEQQVNGARTPVTITLRSDEQTEVVMYHVGQLGVFREHRMSLRPGTYTVVGSRTGYRDVRREFSVQAGKPPPPIEIRCQEKI